MNIITLLALSTIIPTIVLAICTVFSGRERPASNRLLGILYCIVALITISAVILSDWEYMRSIPLAYIFNLTISLFGPVYYLYMKSSIQDRFPFRKRYVVMFIPFICVFIWFLYNSLEKDIFYGRYIERFPYKAFEIAQNAAYFFGCLALLKKNGISLQRFFFDFRIPKLTWLRFLYASLIVFVMYNINTSIRHESFNNPYFYRKFIYGFFVFVCVFLGIILYVSFNWQRIFSPAKRYAVSSLTEEDKQKYYALLVECMDKEKPYLDSTLSLAALARRMKAPVKIVSQVINEKTGFNFNDYINEFRIGEFCDLLDESPADTSILDLLLEAGFNSKSTFNDVFKKKKGMTPSEYRQTRK